MTEATPKPDRFNEILVVLDDQSWIWQLVSSHLGFLNLAHVRLPSNVPVRQSWDRLKNAQRIVVHWEAKQRSGGAVIEEILDVQPNFDVADRIIVLTTNPTHEDVVYFSELGVRRIIRLRNRDKELQQSGRELDMHLTAESEKDKQEQAWRKLLYVLDTLPDDVPADTLARVEASVRKLKPDEYTARYLDAIAKINMLKDNDDAAMRGWHQALDKNPNYYRAYHNMILFFRKRGRPQEALALMQKMHELNKSNVSRLVGMGEIQMQVGDEPKAEFYFKSALDRDQYCSGALNGLAEIRFHQGDLEESRRLLARSHLAYKAAAKLNLTGIDLVKKNKYTEALDHYTRAQYVLPQQDKGPLLFYNIGLCYSRWGKREMAREFLKIALIKEPNYKKARRLLEQVESQLGETGGQKTGPNNEVA
jgi:tetratricopeptide (TPR) repeat protein